MSLIFQFFLTNFHWTFFTSKYRYLEISLSFSKFHRIFFGEDALVRSKFRTKSHENKERNSTNFTLITFAQYCSFHLLLATAINQGRLLWSDCDAILERLQTFFTNQDLRTQPCSSDKDCVVGSIAIPPAQAILAVTCVARMIWQITPCCIVPKEIPYPGITSQRNSNTKQS